MHKVKTKYMKSCESSICEICFLIVANSVLLVKRSFEYGPCVGVTRLERWERAFALGLNPPDEVCAIPGHRLLISTQHRYTKFWPRGRERKILVTHNRCWMGKYNVLFQVSFASCVPSSLLSDYSREDLTSLQTDFVRCSAVYYDSSSLPLLVHFYLYWMLIY